MHISFLNMWSMPHYSIVGHSTCTYRHIRNGPRFRARFAALLHPRASDTACMAQAVQINRPFGAMTSRRG